MCKNILQKICEFACVDVCVNVSVSPSCVSPAGAGGLVAAACGAAGG